MPSYGIAILYTLFIWWFSTGVILYLDGLPKHTFRWSMLGATALLAWSLYGLAATSMDTSVTGAYLAFTYAMFVWGWQEMSFLMGYVTGPRQTPCPTGSRGWRRARYALETIFYHEIALVVSMLVVLAVTWGGSNQVGKWTFLILWVMRLSAKLNVFLGVRNLYEEFLPDNLRYLHSYFTRKSMNALFPVVVTLSSVVAFYLWRHAFASEASAFQTTGASFLATLLTLAIIEHGFLVLPIPATALWTWGLRSRAKRESNYTGGKQADRSVPFELAAAEPVRAHTARPGC